MQYTVQQFRVSVGLSRLAEGRLASPTEPVRMHGAEGQDGFSTYRLFVLFTLVSRAGWLGVFVKRC